MALDGTRTGLLASIADFLNRGDLTASIPDFVTLAEAQINRRIRVQSMVTVNAAYSITGATVAQPSGFLEPISLQLSTRETLDNVSLEALTEIVRANGGSTGKPTSYAVSGSNLAFDTAPVTAYTASLVYYTKVPSLTALAPSNWLLSAYPDAYLYGALLQAGPYLIDDPRTPVWAEMFTTILADIEKADRRSSYGARLTPLTSQVA